MNFQAQQNLLLNLVPKNAVNKWERALRTLQTVNCNRTVSFSVQVYSVLLFRYSIASQLNNECKLNFPLQDILQVATWAHSMCVSRVGISPWLWGGIISIGTDVCTSSWNCTYSCCKRVTKQKTELIWKFTSQIVEVNIQAVFKTISQRLSKLYMLLFLCKLLLRIIHRYEQDTQVQNYIGKSLAE